MWANIVLQMWGNKIKYEDSLEKSIREMIDSLSI
jgi:hypothetical protein